MTTISSALHSQIVDAFGRVHVSVIGRDGNAFAVQVPTGRLPHDAVLVAVEPVGSDEWMISDGTATSRMLDDDFDQVVADIRCAGAPFEVQGKQLVARASTSQLAAAVLSFCHHLTAMPVVWHVHRCQEGDEHTDAAEEPRATGQMLDRAFDAIAARLREPHHSAYLDRNREVANKGERVRVPLTVALPRKSVPPRLITTFIDLGAPKQSVQYAKRRTSWLLDVVSDFQIPKYIVARGSMSDVGHIAAVYDRANVSVVDDANLGRLVEDALEAIDTLA